MGAKRRRPDDEGRLRCSSCTTWKEPDLFPLNARMLCGRNSICYDCMAAKTRDYYERTIVVRRRAGRRAYRAARRVKIGKQRLYTRRHHTAVAAYQRAYRRAHHDDLRDAERTRDRARRRPATISAVRHSVAAWVGCPPDHILRETEGCRLAVWLLHAPYRFPSAAIAEALGLAVETVDRTLTAMRQMRHQRFMRVALRWCRAEARRRRSRADHPPDEPAAPAAWTPQDRYWRIRNRQKAWDIPTGGHSP